MRDTTRSHTIATVIHLEILSGKNDSKMTERVLNFHVRYWYGQNISPQVNTICAPLTTRFIVSATARLVRNFEDVLEVSVFRMTIILRTLPKIPAMIIIGPYYTIYDSPGHQCYIHITFMSWWRRQISRTYQIRNVFRRIDGALKRKKKFCDLIRGFDTTSFLFSWCDLRQMVHVWREHLT